MIIWNANRFREFNTHYGSLIKENYVITIDLIGSCISRDVFNRVFIPEHNTFFTLKYYLPRCPIPCLVTKGLDSPYKLCDDYVSNPWQFEVFYKNLSKSLYVYLSNNQSDILMLDFYEDASRGVIEIGNDYFPNFSPLKKMLDVE